MTTIIVVVVVALVFFVSLCTVTFMVWKREEEMRTDSLRAIEANLQELGYRMTEDFGRSTRKSSSLRNGIEPISIQGSIGKSDDPFSWTREDDKREHENPAEHQVATQKSDDARDVQPLGELASTEVIEPVAESDELESIQTLETIPEDAGHVVSDAEVKPEAETKPEADTNQVTMTAEQPVTETIENSVDEIEEISDFDRIVSELEQLGGTVDVGASIEKGAPEGADDATASMGAFANDYSINDLNQLMSEDFEINLDDIDIPELMGGYIADYSADDIPQPKPPIGRDVGRSGRRYTAEELDMLIKE